jgi:hypothetical protein
MTISKVSWLKKRFMGESASWFIGVAFAAQAVLDMYGDWYHDRGYGDLWNWIWMSVVAVILMLAPEKILKYTDKKFE